MLSRAASASGTSLNGMCTRTYENQTPSNCSLRSVRSRRLILIVRASGHCSRHSRKACSLTSSAVTRYPRSSSCLVSLPELHPTRSEEHTSELQSQFHLVCRLLLEKKKAKGSENVR